MAPRRKFLSYQKMFVRSGKCHAQKIQKIYGVTDKKRGESAAAGHVPTQSDSCMTIV